MKRPTKLSGRSLIKSSIDRHPDEDTEVDNWITKWIETSQSLPDERALPKFEPQGLTEASTRSESSKTT